MYMSEYQFQFIPYRTVALLCAALCFLGNNIARYEYGYSYE